MATSVAHRGAGTRYRWWTTVSTALARISTPHIRICVLVGVGCSSTPRMVGPISAMRSRTSERSKRPSSTSTKGMMGTGPWPAAVDGGPRKLMAMMSPSLTGMDRPAALTTPGRGSPSSTAGRRA
jgi:hypothetical protein